MTIETLGGGIGLLVAIGVLMLVAGVIFAPLFIARNTRRSSEELKRIRELLERQAARDAHHDARPDHRLELR